MTKAAAILGDGAVRISLSPRWLVVRFDRIHTVLSSAIIGGGRRKVRDIVWHEVRNDELPLSIDPVTMLRGRLAAIGRPNAAGLLTSCAIGSYVVSECRHGGVSSQVVATVGLGNALRVGDRPGLRRRIGTINILCRVSHPLTEEAQIEALSVVAEARTLAVLEGSVPSRRSGRASTGTGTDCIVIACPPGRRPERYAGKHTALGHVIGKAVLQALRRGVASWIEGV
jgi:adenosylcobinamide amidohydrolase